MNETEQRAYRWLLALGYKAEEITHQRNQSPDFLTEDGEGWEVKLSRNNAVTFSTVQAETLSPACHVLVFGLEGAEPLEHWQRSDLTIPGVHGKYRLGMFDTNKDRVSPTAHISLPEEVVAYCRRESDRMGIATGTLLRILVLEAISQREKENHR